jgi:hypothetical protein
VNFRSCPPYTRAQQEVNTTATDKHDSVGVSDMTWNFMIYDYDDPASFRLAISPGMVAQRENPGRCGSRRAGGRGLHVTLAHLGMRTPLTSRPQVIDDGNPKRVHDRAQHSCRAIGPA